MECPYCSEEIKESAKKCKHCGEWLEQTGEWSGSSDARSVSKGLKEKEFDDFTLTVIGGSAIILSIAVGYYIHWILGAAIFIFSMVKLTSWYYNE